MNAAGQLAAREDEALGQLKAKLNVPSGTSSHIDAFLLRFLRSTNLHVEAAVDKLQRRREYEHTLPSLSVTPHAVRSLRSGAFGVLGKDPMRRPILYVRMGLYRLPHESSETEKLVIILTEFMQALSMAGSAQEIVILINEQNAGWFAHHNGLIHGQLAVLALKYYPELVGQVLVVDAPWSVQQGIRTKLPTSDRERARNVIKFVNRGDLGKNIDPSVIPIELGGRNRTYQTDDFSEIVMRHWYGMASALAQEVAIAASRPLWQPAVSGTGSYTTMTSAHASERRHAAFRANRNRAPSSIAASTPRLRGNAPPPSDAVTDDGVCSVISESDFLMDVPDDEQSAYSEPETASVPGEARNASVSEELAPRASANTRDLRVELTAERERRAHLENELAKLQLGVTIDETTLTKLEAKLRQVHQEVNILVGETVQRTKMVDAPPTLGQLLEMTDNAIMSAIQEKQSVGAMRFAAPTDRKPERSCVVQ